MNSDIRVFKFGGASIKDSRNIRNVASIVEQYQGERLLIVVSAMGKTTNALEAIVAAHAQQNGTALTLLEKLKQQHFQQAQDLFGASAEEALVSLNDTFVEIEWALEDEPHEDYDYMYDQIVSVGELASSKMLAAYLNHVGTKTHWLDARDVILTDNLYRSAAVQWEETLTRAKTHALPEITNKQCVLTQGFIGTTSENFTTTLGREGSDYTAAIFSFCLDAKDMSIWKDVPGVLTADPRLFENVSKLERLSYREAIEMTYYGAKVIHPKTIKPLQNKSIPLYVKSFLAPNEEGTLISSEVEDKYPPMVAVEKNQAVLYISTRDFSFVAEHHMSFLFNKIAEFRLQVNMMQNTAISFAICVNNINDKIRRFTEDIEEEFGVIIDEGLELYTIRHYNAATTESLLDNKMVVLEERTPNTLQMVVKELLVMRRKDVSIQKMNGN
ncbi:MAG: aspartate kinase [Bacteroidota bacterium]